MRPHDSKDAKSAQKSARLWDAVRSYQYLVLGVLAHLYVLLLVTLASEAQLIGVDAQALVNYVALASLIVLIVSRALRWSWPMLLEEALLVLFLWVLLSSLLAAHAPCLTLSSVATDATLDTGPPSLPLALLPQQAGDNDTVSVASVAPADDVVVHSLDEDAAVPLHTALWGHLSGASCASEPFDQLYSALCVLLALCAFAVDVRHYWLSLLFRGATLLLLVLVAVLPSQCALFSLGDLNVLIVKLTLYNALWFLGHYARMTQQLLGRTYATALDCQAEPPRALFDAVQQRLRRGGEEERARVQQKLARLPTRAPWITRWLSWKHRAYAAAMLLVVDCGRTLWLLLVCPWWLVAAAPQAAWLLWQVRQASGELREARKYEHLLALLARGSDFAEYG